MKYRVGDKVLVSSDGPNKKGYYSRKQVHTTHEPITLLILEVHTSYSYYATITIDANIGSSTFTKELCEKHNLPESYRQQFGHKGLLEVAILGFAPKQPCRQCK